jgi:hypothetical protein
MNNIPRNFLILLFMAGFVSCRENKMTSVTVPFVLDHNRMLVEAEFRLKDGNWRKAILWVDTGNPDFFISESFARDLGIEIQSGNTDQEIPSPSAVRIGGMAVSFDYPAMQLTLAEPGILIPRGVPGHATINPDNGIIQMDASIDGVVYSFALDNGASFSYVPDFLVTKLLEQHPDWPNATGAVGYANIWGWWPGEDSWPMIRVPEISWGPLIISDAVLVGLPPIFRGGTDVGTNYSRKTARPVNGFFGPNMFKGYRIEIDYTDSTLYFEKGRVPHNNDMDIVGLTIKPLNDGRYRILGVAMKNNKPVLEGIRQGDVLLRIDNLETTGATMGTVVDALRGRPGEKRTLLLEREGTQFKVEARVERII